MLSADGLSGAMIAQDPSHDLSALGAIEVAQNLVGAANQKWSDRQPAVCSGSDLDDLFEGVASESLMTDEVESNRLRIQGVGHQVDMATSEVVGAEVRNHGSVGTLDQPSTIYSPQLSLAENPTTAKVSSGRILDTDLVQPKSAPSSVTNLRVINEDGQVTLVWSAASGASSYTVDYSTNGGGSWTNFSGTITATTATIGSLTNGTSYVFRVAGKSALATGSYSDTINNPVVPSKWNAAVGAPIQGLVATTYSSSNSGPGNLNLTADGADSDAFLWPNSMLVVPNVDFDWGSNSVLNSNRSDGVLVRFQGFIVNLTSLDANYDFRAYGDDGVHLLINGNVVLSNWAADGGTVARDSTTSVSLKAGEAKSFTFWYYEATGGAKVQLLWRAVGTTNYSVVPTTAFLTPSFLNSALFNKDDGAYSGSTALQLTNQGSYLSNGGSQYSLPTVTGTNGTVEKYGFQNINFNWGTGNALYGTDPDSVLIYFEGYLQNPYNTVTSFDFQSYHDDGIKLFISGQASPTIEYWADSGRTDTSSTPVTFQPREVKLIRLWVREWLGDAAARLSWRVSGSSSFATIPFTSFVSPPESVGNLTGTKSGNSVTLTWSAPVLAAVPVSDYLIDTSTDNGTTWVTFNDGVSTSTTATIPVPSSSGYRVRVRAVNTVGIGDAAELPRVTLASTSDTGSSQTDGVTRLATPTVTVSRLDGIRPSVGDVVEVLDVTNSGAVVGSYTLVASDVSWGQWSISSKDITLTTLSSGTRELAIQIRRGSTILTKSEAQHSVTVDTASPAVASVSSSVADGNYGVGAVISIQVIFSEVVNVVGVPTLALNAGGGASATYSSIWWHSSQLLLHCCGRSIEG